MKLFYELTTLMVGINSVWKSHTLSYGYVLKDVSVYLRWWPNFSAWGDI